MTSTKEQTVEWIFLLIIIWIANMVLFSGLWPVKETYVFYAMYGKRLSLEIPSKDLKIMLHHDFKMVVKKHTLIINDEENQIVLWRSAALYYYLRTFTSNIEED